VVLEWTLYGWKERKIIIVILIIIITDLYSAFRSEDTSVICVKVVI